MANPSSATDGVPADQGVLLYYKYIDLSEHQDGVQQFYLQLCGRLEQLGRIRVARDGINVTVRSRI